MIDSIDTQEEYRPKAKVFYVVTSRAELENWASNNTSLDGDEIKQIGNYELTKDHLDLVSDNNQDAGIVSFVYGMTPYHLDKFRRFIPTEKGMRELVEFDRKWLGQAERFDHVENDAEFLREHYLEAIASSA
ncbi:hypothetical protein CMI45_00855 [Candidatus Pacearchaeota archaeon]|nr:hypothetical protein [Candidatus Pacearchaeota archaeon]|tara:strand:- start:348 stop:743 length:396 start_codon:yes stop_codon:yes gene_type:complete